MNEIHVYQKSSLLLKFLDTFCHPFGFNFVSGPLILIFTILISGVFLASLSQMTNTPLHSNPEYGVLKIFLTKDPFKSQCCCFLYSWFCSFLSLFLFSFLCLFKPWVLRRELRGSVNGSGGTLDNIGTWKTNIVLFDGHLYTFRHCCHCFPRGAVSRGFVFSMANRVWQMQSWFTQICRVNSDCRQVCRF